MNTFTRECWRCERDRITCSTMDFSWYPSDDYIFRTALHLLYSHHRSDDGNQYSSLAPKSTHDIEQIKKNLGDTACILKKYVLWKNWMRRMLSEDSGRTSSLEWSSSSWVVPSSRCLPEWMRWSWIMGATSSSDKILISWISRIPEPIRSASPSVGRSISAIHWSSPHGIVSEKLWRIPTSLRVVENPVEWSWWISVDEAGVMVSSVIVEHCIPGVLSHPLSLRACHFSERSTSLVLSSPSSVRVPSHSLRELPILSLEPRGVIPLMEQETSVSPILAVWILESWDPQSSNTGRLIQREIALSPSFEISL